MGCLALVGALNTDVCLRRNDGRRNKTTVGRVDEMAARIGKVVIVTSYRPFVLSLEVGVHLILVDVHSRRDRQLTHFTMQREDASGMELLYARWAWAHHVMVLLVVRSWSLLRLLIGGTYPRHGEYSGFSDLCTSLWRTSPRFPFWANLR